MTTIELTKIGSSLQDPCFRISHFNPRRGMRGCCDKQNGAHYLVAKKSFFAYDVIKQFLAHVTVHRGQWVVQNVDIRVTVHSSG